jgi:uncharacterized protein (DUF169 family)
METTMQTWKALTQKFEQLIRPRTFPVALKFLEDKAELRENKWVRRPKRKQLLCQLMTTVRTYKWTVGVTAEDLALPVCRAVVGLGQRPRSVMDGSSRSMVWCKTKEDARKCETEMPTIPFGKYEALLLAPLVQDPFDPDMILIYGNPAQMVLVINAIQYEDYERMQFFCVGESSCSDVIAQCYLTGKPALSIPCYGERRFGHAQDDELAMGLPPDYFEKVVENLEALYNRGIRYPIAYFGAGADPEEGFPLAYRDALGMD